MQAREVPWREGVDSRPYFHIHTSFIPKRLLAILPGQAFTVSQTDAQGALDHWTLISKVEGSICHVPPL